MERTLIAKKGRRVLARGATFFPSRAKQLMRGEKRATNSLWIICCTILLALFLSGCSRQEPRGGEPTRQLITQDTKQKGWFEKIFPGSKSEVAPERLSPNTPGRATPREGVGAAPNAGSPTGTPPTVLAEADRKPEEYKVVLFADKTIAMPGPPGGLTVWIGFPQFNPEIPKNTVTEHGQLPALGATANIIPFAPAFTVEPQDTKCIQIVPSGSQVSFTLTPKEAGTFEVGAEVDLYPSDNCTGTRIPKGTTYVEVQVVVEHSGPFLRAFWKALLKFWIAILALFFAVVLYLIRKQLKKWIGYGK